jgi:uncharacterized linocin/CFP29 family protein
MGDYLMRSAAPFSAEEWAKIDAMAVMVLKSTLVGRRFVDLVGPLGWGVENAPLTGFTIVDGAAVAQEAVYLPLKEISSEFIIKAKQMAIAAQTPFALDLGAVALAAIKLAKEEDNLVVLGLLDAAQNKTALGDWDVFGAAFKAVATAAALLQNTGNDAPYALVLNPIKYAQLAGSMQQGREELEMVEEVVKGGIFQSTVMPANKVLVVSPKAWNLDMVVGQDAITAYVGNVGMDQRLRLFESLVLRVKLPKAICVLA